MKHRIQSYILKLLLALRELWNAIEYPAARLRERRDAFVKSIKSLDKDSEG
jgi:hypothetical protein